MAWVGFIWLRTRPMAGSCEKCSGNSDAIEGDEYIDKLSDYRLLSKDSTSCSYVDRMELASLILHRCMFPEMHKENHGSQKVKSVLWSKVEPRVS